MFGRAWSLYTCPSIEVLPLKTGVKGQGPPLGVKKGVVV